MVDKICQRHAHFLFEQCRKIARIDRQTLGKCLQTKVGAQLGVHIGDNFLILEEVIRTQIPFYEKTENGFELKNEYSNLELNYYDEESDSYLPVLSGKEGDFNA